MIETISFAITILFLIIVLIIQNNIINDQYKDIQILESRADVLQRINRIQGITLNAYRRAREEKQNEQSCK